MILAVDVGNTNIVLGLYRDRTLLHHWRVSTNRSATVDEYGMMFQNLFEHSGISFQQVDGVIISSVVPPLVFVMENLCLKYIKKTAFIVGPGIKTGLHVKVDNPKEVGADRIVNAVAALELYGAPCIIVDFGTASTYDYIDPSGHLVGCAIAPGIGISTEALYQKAAKLPRIELIKPKSVIGRNTVSAMQSGIIFGFSAQVDGIVSRIKAEFEISPTVIATGGLAELIASESKMIQVVNPLLTLQGLQMIYEKNA
ncbi:type III pantothenate kinase [Paenibacillus eucommiae]|uniref:Type III pantothenate kinase n=1 Tax=Paenibacillus eucommiae TaxID=1355755 RepID=A0ABS4J8I6_9BACL|nr:type III pantothenate kinase [Paenibacillus eucommiae]MBP1996153.1 type III pantothenate kinase [Paenibacillus eucommiae]